MTRLDQNISEKETEVEYPKPDIKEPEFKTAAQYASSRKSGMQTTPLRPDKPETEEEEVPETREVIEPPETLGMKVPDMVMGDPVNTSKIPEVEDDYSDEESEELTDEDKLDMYASSNSVSHEHLVSKRRRKEIESRLAPLDIGDLVTTSGITQVVEAVPGKLSYTLRSLSQAETLFCYKYVARESSSVAFSEEMLNTCRLVCIASALNGTYFTPHMNDKFEVDEEMFEAKFKQISKLPAPLIADMSVQAVWFSDRVSALFTFDALKNG